MKIIARMDNSPYHNDRKILVEMTSLEFANCAGLAYATELPSIEVGTTLNVSKNFLRLRQLQNSSVTKAAKQLVAIAELLEPLQDVLSVVNGTPAEGKE